MTNLTIKLKNPPSDGTMWSIRLTDWNVTTLIDFIGKNGKERLDIAEVATFEVPGGLYLPLRVVDLSIKKWKDGIVGGTIQYLYAVQSYLPYLWDWDLWDYGTEPDPTYREIFIPALGSYYYNVATEQFEEIAGVVPCKITIDAPDSAQEGEKVSVSALLKNVSTYGSLYKTEIYAVPDLFPSFRIGTIEKYINSGSTFTAYGSFTMPASNTTILIWVERWAVDHWVYDNSASKVVSLAVVEVGFSQLKISSFSKK
ncbi:hypothetical protein ES703_32289 [subsurface metagenome]